MENYDEEYANIVKTPPTYNYDSAEKEARRIQKHTLLKNESIRYESATCNIDRSNCPPSIFKRDTI